MPISRGAYLNCVKVDKNHHILSVYLVTLKQPS